MSLAATWIAMGRMGIGLIFFLSIFFDLKTRSELFKLMKQKLIPWPWVFYLGAITWKALTGLALIFDIATVITSLLLAIYIFIANIILNNFWAVPKDQRSIVTNLFFIHLAVCFGLLILSGAAMAT